MGRLITDGDLGGFPPGRGTWEPTVWRWAVTTFGAQSFLDIGCGPGHAVQFCHDLGLRAAGLDGSPKAFAMSPCPTRLEMHDFSRGEWPPNTPGIPSPAFDLVWSAEFVEHIEEKYLSNFLPAFATAQKAILLLHGIPGQKGHHHVNCQPPEYWIGHLGRMGYRWDESATLAARPLSRFANRGWGAKGLVFVPV